MIKRFWNSPTLMTWMSYSTRALTLFGVLPLVLKVFTPGDLVLWYLFSTIIALQSLADLGFRQTFSRIISFAFGGAQDIGIYQAKKISKGAVPSAPNVELLGDIISTMKFIYLFLTIFVVIFGGIFGTWAMINPIANTSNIANSWTSWVIVLLVSGIGFYGKVYLNFLEGLNKIAVVRRIETLTSIGAIGTSISVLIISPSLLNLVIVNQFWVIVVTLRDWYLCRNIDNRFFLKVAKKMQFNRPIFIKIWSPAWRSGISNFMSLGLTNLTGIIYAQIGDASGVAAYLLAIRIINQIKEVSMAPFYSKLPLLARMRVSSDVSGLIALAKKGMFLSNLVFVMGFIVVGLFSKMLLHAIGSEVVFVSDSMWILLGLAFFIHRFGAMHMQVYLSTNHVISHIADGVSGVLFIISALILSRYVGIYSIPLGMMVGYLGFYSWYAAKYSLKSLNIGFWEFERKASLLPLSIILIYIVFKLLIK